MKLSDEELWEDQTNSEMKSPKLKRKKSHWHELEDLREHIDLISFNLKKVYCHAKDRSRKEDREARLVPRRKLHHAYKNGK